MNSDKNALEQVTKTSYIITNGTMNVCVSLTYSYCHKRTVHHVTFWYTNGCLKLLKSVVAYILYMMMFQWFGRN